MRATLTLALALTACGPDVVVIELTAPAQPEPETPVASVDTATGPGPETCPWVGEWSLTAATCGNFDMAAVAEGGAIEQVLVDISDTGAGCQLSIQWDAQDCQESETWAIPAPVEPGIAIIDRQGIEECLPVGCLLEEADDRPCAVGDLTSNLTAEIEENGVAVIFHLETMPIPSCTINGSLTLLPR